MNIEHEKILFTRRVPDCYSLFRRRRKIAIFVVSTFVGFLGPISGNIYMPLIPKTAEAFDVSVACINATVSVFMVVFAVMPLLWASLSDSFGRRPVTLVALIIFVFANTLLAAIPAHIAALFVLRVFQAIGGSTMSVGIGMIGDIIEPSKRGQFISYYMLGPQSGPIIGPILGIVGAETNWRWNFGILAIFGVVGFVAAIFLLPETLRCLVGKGNDAKSLLAWKGGAKIEASEFPKPPSPHVKSYWKLVTFKPVMLCSLTGGFVFMSFYTFIVSFSNILKQRYGLSDMKVCLSYICPGVSLVLGSLFFGRLSDYVRQKKDPSIPEKRFRLQILGVLLHAAGILAYGWIVQGRVHIAAVFVMASLTAFGASGVLITNTTYLSESSKTQIASLVALGNFMRNIGATIAAGVVNPIAIRIGYGWTFTISMGITLVAGCFTWLIVKNGQKWRAEKQFLELGKEKSSTEAPSSTNDV